ncbi:class I SAM-dependent methyltransferase [Longimycelium tulufanense]|nr:class I SAM-dependent methyltransferase [Longimycelium tulufanense]
MSTIDRQAEPDALETQARGENLTELVSQLPMAGVRTILEVGCGSGALTRALAMAAGPGTRVVGVDVRTTSLTVASRCASRSGLTNIEFVHGDLLSPDLPHALAQRFDLVVCRYFLMYLVPRDLARTGVQRMMALARPGGLVACYEVDANFGADRFPPPSAGLQRVLDSIVPVYRQLKLVEWRCGIMLHHLLTASGLSEVDVRVADGRTICGTRPAALVEHGCRDVADLLLPCVRSLGDTDRLEEYVEEWARYLRSPNTFLYTPILLGTGKTSSQP